jgi:hypothetical protein
MNASRIGPEKRAYGLLFPSRRQPGNDRALASG